MKKERATQINVLKFIHQDNRGYTNKELSEIFGVTKQAMSYCLRAMKKKGLIVPVAGDKRSQFYYTTELVNNFKIIDK